MPILIQSYLIFAIGYGAAWLMRVPHRIAANPHNAGYLATKRDRTGHQL